MAAADLLWTAMVAVSFCCCFVVADKCPHSLEEARPSASGYLSINQSSGSSMFFAYYEAIESSKSWSRRTKLADVSAIGVSADDEDSGNDTIPVILWLQGGPGCSGMIGNFFELGPWRVGEDLCLHRNPAPWNRIFGLLVLDSPVGSGFSIASLEEDIPMDQDGIARDVYTALQEFYDLFPTLRARPFYVTGESYAGKYVPSVASYILQKQQQMQGTSSQALRLDGIAIGNGLTHPIVQILDHSPTAYHMGLIDEIQKEAVSEMAEKAVMSIESEDWLDAYHARVGLLAYLRNITGLATLLDVRKTVGYYVTANGTDYLSLFMNKEEVQKSLLKVEPQLWSDCNDTVASRMATDVPQSTLHSVEFVLNQSIPVLLYQGQFDLQDGVASNEAWIGLLNWEGIDSFKAVERKAWKEGGITLGYVRSSGLLMHVVISHAGHLVPADQPYSSQRMIEGWITGSGIV